MAVGPYEPIRLVCSPLVNGQAGLARKRNTVSGRIKADRDKREWRLKMNLRDGHSYLVHGSALSTPVPGLCKDIHLPSPPPPLCQPFVPVWYRLYGTLVEFVGILFVDLGQDPIATSQSSMVFGSLQQGHVGLTRCRGTAGTPPRQP